MRAIICPPGEGATIDNPLGGPLTFEVRGDQTNGALTAFESSVAPGEGPPLHVHANEDEILYVSQEAAGCPWQVFVRRRHMAGPETGHPVIGWFGHGGWLGRTKKEAHRDLQRTNAALVMHLRRVGKLTE